MAKLAKTLTFMALSAAVYAAPAAAQSAGIATAEPALVVARSQALKTAYGQINTTFANNNSQIAAKQTTINNYRKQLDKNGDKQIDQAELDSAQKANTPAFQGMVREEQAIANLQAPILRAQRYVVSEIFKQYQPSQQQVVSDKKISVILSPEAFLYAPKEANVTDAIVKALDKRVPAVSTAVPANWQPTRQAAGLHQQVSQIIVTAARIQNARAQQATQQGAAAAPAPAGR